MLVFGQDVQVVICFECVQVVDGLGVNWLQVDFVMLMYFGDCWEYLFYCGEMCLCVFGYVLCVVGKYWIEFLINDCWVFVKVG